MTPNVMYSFALATAANEPNAPNGDGNGGVVAPPRGVFGTLYAIVAAFVASLVPRQQPA